MLVQASEIEKFIITTSDSKSDKELDVIKNSAVSVVNLYFYENLLSPYITGVVSLMSTGSVEGISEKGLLVSAKQLPIEAGSKIRMKIKTLLGPGVDFSSDDDVHKQLIINEVQVIDKTSPTKELIQIRFTSIIGPINSAVKVGNKLEGKVSSVVENILKDKLLVKEDAYEVDETMNSVSMNGMQKDAFEMMGILARQSIPATNKGKANPGYLFYQTKSGFKFKSISSLITRKPFSETYHFNGKTPDIDSDKNNYKVARLDILRDQNLMKQIQSGVYASKNWFFNPAEYKFTEIDITVEEEKLVKDKDLVTLGEKDKIVTPEVVEDGIKSGQVAHRIQTSVMSVEPLKDELINTSNPDSIENNPEFWYAAGSTRYNILFSQKIAITVPCNTNLEVGMKIKLEAENVAYCSGIDGPDERTSGEYLIQALCHYGDVDKSVTSLELIRDSYGMNFSADETGDVSNSFLMSGSFGKLQEDVELTAEEQAYKNMENSGRSVYLGGGL